MKYPLFLLIVTVAATVINALPYNDVGGNLFYAPPSGGDASGAILGVTDDIAQTVTSSTDPPPKSDIEVKYKGVTAPKDMEFDDCVALTDKKCHVLEYFRFASVSSCLLYSDNKCKLPFTSAPVIVFPPLVKVPNEFSALNVVLGSYRCFSPTDPKIIERVADVSGYTALLQDPSKFAKSIPNPKSLVSSVLGGGKSQDEETCQPED